MPSNGKAVTALGRTLANARTFALVLSTALAGSLACDSMMGGAAAAQPTAPWNQQLVTQIAAGLESQLTNLYDTAEQEPEFAGERSEYGKTLDNLRILKEEATEMHAKLKDGKGQAETMTNVERIREVARDTQESDSWEFLPVDFRNQASTVLTSLNQLDAYFGAP